MKPHWLPIAAFLLGTGSAVAEPSLVLFGLGRDSCANWQSSPSKQQQGDVWIMGFWSGRNHQNTRNHQIGIETDAYGIIGEVKKICSDSPSSTLYGAASSAYDKMVPLPRVPRH